MPIGGDQWRKTHPSLRRRIARELVAMLWQQPLWAIPFALFFGTFYGSSWKSYWIAYKISLVFAYTIRLCLSVFEFFVFPALKRRFARGRRLSLWIEAPSFGLAALIGSLLAAYVIHLYVIPGFLGSARAITISAGFSVVFVVMIGGIIYAIEFYRESMDRARAVERMRAELAEAELRALRAQINPHFLFNTLNSIASLIGANPAAAEETTTQLAEVFRYALTASDREHARFADELAFLRTYLEIERTRFGERLRIEEAIEPGLDSVLVPSLLLQPLVENAIRYGVSPQRQGGTVRIAARRSGATLRLEVADDGPGFDGTAHPTGTGFGLHSVRERLSAAGPPHALEIDSRPGEGTRVLITLPVLLAATSRSTEGGDPS